MSVAFPAGAAAAPARCADAPEGIAATLGLWDGRPIDDLAAAVEDPENANLAYPEEIASGLATAGVVARVQRRRGRVVRAELCSGRRLIARLPLRDARARIGGLSANGRFVAWRTWRPGRPGTIAVGRVKGRRIVSVRRTPTPALARADRVNGRIAVMPEGSAAWSLPDGARAGVWLWPRGRPSRRVALTAIGDMRERSWDVRIVDARHVLLGASSRIARYGSSTPGRCPTPFGARTHALGDVRVSTLGALRYPQDSGSFSVESYLPTVTCDSVVGDYIDATTTRAVTSLHDQDATTPQAAHTTAGVVVLLLQRSTTGVPNPVTNTSVVVVAGKRQPFIAAGLVSGSRLAPPFPPPSAPLVGVQLIAGAVAWVAGPGETSPSSGLRSIWLADADGVRVVGQLGPGTPEDPALTLDATTVTWTGAGGAESAAVRPRPGDTVRSTSLRRAPRPSR